MAGEPRRSDWPSGRCCANCHAPLSGAFCAACGQAIETHRRSLYRLVRGFIADLLSLESRTLRTTWVLLARPGELSRAFKEGRIQRYVPPVRLYLFVSLLFFVALVFHPSGAGAVQPAIPGFCPPPLPAARPVMPWPPTWYFSSPSAASRTGTPRPGTRSSGSATSRTAGARENAFERAVFQTLYRLQADPAALNGPLTEWLPRILFVLLPLFAMVMALFYFRQPAVPVCRSPGLLAEPAQFRLRGPAGGRRAGPDAAAGGGGRMAVFRGGLHLSVAGHETVLRPGLGADRAEIRRHRHYLFGFCPAAGIRRP